LPFWSKWNADIKAAAPSNFMSLGELLDGDPSLVAKAWRGGGFTSMFDFPLAFAMGDVFCRGESPSKLAAVLTNDRRYPDPSKLVTLLDNHDLPRIMSVCGGNVDKVRAALAFMFTTRGLPSIIWGTEIGMEGSKEPENRKSMIFSEHPLKNEIAFWLQARAKNPALADGIEVVLAASSEGVVLGRIASSQIALVVVGREGGVRPSFSAGRWAEASKELVPPGGWKGSSMTVFVSEVNSDAYRGFQASHEPQWRTGVKRRSITFEGPAGTFVVGIGPELGDWNPAKALALPATVELPLGGAFEFKTIRREGERTLWESSANGTLFVEEAGKSRVVLQPSFPR
jgi:hypothetical protein